MRRIFAFILTIGLLMIAVAVQAATVTGARWGQMAENSLRFVIDVSAETKYDVQLSGNNLIITVDGEPAEGVIKSYPIGRKLADSMSVKKTGTKTVLTVGLKQTISSGEYKGFALKSPYRVVVDVTPGGVKAPAPKTTTEASSTIKKPANTGSTWTPTNSTTTTGSWTDRFKKNDKPDNQQLTPSQKVKQMIEQSQKGQSTGIATTTVKPLPSNQTGKETVTTTQEKVAQQQSSLKKYLTAKQNARREAKAKADANKKKLKKGKDGTTTTVQDGITYIKGNGKYRVNGGIKDKVIVIDPGHGGTDPGAIGAGGTQEKNITMPISMLLKDNLIKAGAKVYMTRTTDVDVAGAYASDRAELQGRVNVAEKYNADIFISIHINSAVNRSLSGLSCYYHPKTSHDARLAKAIQTKLVSNFKMNDLGIREANFYVNKRSSMPSTLLELGFISNSSDENNLKSKWFQEKAAKVICDGIKQYFN